MKIVSNIKESIKAAYRRVSDKFKKIKERRKQITQERIAEYERNERRYQEFRKNKAAKKFERRETKRNKQDTHIPQGRSTVQKRNFHVADDFEEYEIDDRVPRKPFINDRLKNYGRVEDELLQRKSDAKQSNNTVPKDNVAPNPTTQTNVTIIINGEQISSVDINSSNQDTHHVETSAKPVSTSAKPETHSSEVNKAKPKVTINKSQDAHHIETPAKPEIRSNETETKVAINKSQDNNIAKPTKTSAKPDKNETDTSSPKEGGFFNTFEVKPMNLFGDEKDEG